MTSGAGTDAVDRWLDATTASALLLVHPAGCGGMVIKARSSVLAERFVARLRQLAGPNRPVVKLPAGITDDRLMGGLDLARTLEIGRPVLEPGLLARADQGMVLIPGAERLSAGMAARIAMAVDRKCVSIEREGLGREMPARFAVVLVDESSEPDEAPPAALLDRAAFAIDLAGISYRDTDACPFDPEEIESARKLLAGIASSDQDIHALVETADALGIKSQRAPMLALNAARASAALDGRRKVEESDLVLATRLVLAPRATMLPAPSPAQDKASESSKPDTSASSDAHDDREETAGDQRPNDVLLAAAKAALPAGLLDGPLMKQRMRSASAGHSGRTAPNRLRGARMASRPGSPGSGARLDLIATLRNAAPHQRIRRSGLPSGAMAETAVLVHRQDMRVARYKQRSDTLTIFTVDASGSAALHRLAEAKGAVELMLADCYVRRDWVALVAFRGDGSSLLLPPTRSLTRAKRCLGELAGGGGTPLASGMKSAFALSRAAARQGRTATTVVLTDGRPNISLEGKPGRPAAENDALAIARVFAASGERAIVIDTGQRPNAFAQKLAGTLGGRYVPLPYADANAVYSAVKSVV